MNNDEKLEFDLDKVEALNFDNLSAQLMYIFKSEGDIANFIKFLKDLHNFVGLSNDKRHQVLINLGYFKSQIQRYERQINNLIAKRKSAQNKNAIKTGKMRGEKMTEALITYYIEDDSALDGLENLYNFVKCWSDYMTDLTYLCSQTNKNLGSFN